MEAPFSHSVKPLWPNRDLTSNVPGTANVYADNARALDDCGTYNINCDILRRFAAPADGRRISMSE